MDSERSGYWRREEGHRVWQAGRRAGMIQACDSIFTELDSKAQGDLLIELLKRTDNETQKRCAEAITEKLDEDRED